MLNRLFFALTLILSFGMAQIGAVTHEISHYSDIYAQAQTAETAQLGSKSSKPSEPISHNQVCEKCMAYAELGHIAHGTLSLLPLIPAANTFDSTTSLTPSYAKLRTYSARAPPHLA
jgi:hypothetical protein